MKKRNSILSAMLRSELFRAKPATVIHRATCPKCGRKLVNLYRHGLVWRCNKCSPRKEQADD